LRERIIAVGASVGERKFMHLADVRFATPNVWKDVAYKHLQSPIFVIKF
jgi:hypothetical protein